MERNPIFDNTLEGKKYFDCLVNRINTNQLPTVLNNRFQIAEGHGIIGWEKLKTDTSILLWDKIPKKETIELLDKFAQEFSSEEIFLELYEISFGGGEEWFITWIFEKVIDWAAGKGLDFLFERLKEPKVLAIAERLKEQSEFNHQDGKLYIKINPDNEIILNEVILEIVGYPTVMKKIDQKMLDDLKNKITSGTSQRFIYSKAGRFIEGSCPSRLVSIDV